jgi:hypothetical protein
MAPVAGVEAGPPGCRSRRHLYKLVDSYSKPPFEIISGPF